MADFQTRYKDRCLTVASLPALPNTLEEVNRLMESPNASTEQIAKIISYDQALAAKVLGMVNSPIYGFPGRITSLQHALMLLGFNVIRGLIISTAVFDSLSESMAGLWDHSLGCSLACAEVAKTLEMKNPEEYAVSGLLHDLGKAVVSLQMPDAAAEIAELVRVEDIPYREAENRVLGFGHDRINDWLGDQWNLPLVIREGMVHHHAPMRAPFHPEVAAVVQLGDFFVRLYGCGSGGHDAVPQVDPRGLKLLGLNQKTIEKLTDSIGDTIYSVLADLRG